MACEHKHADTLWTTRIGSDPGYAMEIEWCCECGAYRFSDDMDGPWESEPRESPAPGKRP